MSPFGPPWKLGVTGAVAVTAGIALVLVDCIARHAGTVHDAARILGALSILAGGIEIAAALSQRHSSHRSIAVS